jgi:DNA repair protein RecN (Recombination protein N)
MIRFLAVRHLAVLDEVEVEFDGGLNVLTGETGAGKSILVLAIDLLVGGRASAELVRTGEDVASVQAIFERSDGREVIVRREISSQGRSRAFIDDALATSAALRELGATLVDLHGQHEHQTLLNPAEHAGLLDAFAGHVPACEAVAAAFDGWRAAAAALDRTRLDDREKRARIEMAAFQLEEIDRVAPRTGEDAALIAERTVLANADRLVRLSAEAYAALYDGEHAALASLSAVWKRVAELAALDPALGPYLEQRDAVKSQLEDLAMALRGYATAFDAAPERLQQVEDRLAAIERLKKKHGPTLDDVLARQASLREELAALGASEERAAALEAAERQARGVFVDAARDLSGLRRAAGNRLGRSLESQLAELAMPKTRVDVAIERLDEDVEAWTREGMDRVEFLLSPNPGEELKPLARIASGGELSRIMLALRTLAAPDQPGRTLVFDEVDAGIGGAAADAVGARLQALGRKGQVLCITHLPQIAARGGTHLLLTKQVRGGRTSTSIRRLDAPGREVEIGRMIAGAEVSPQVLASARELLAARRMDEDKAKGESESRGGAKAKGKRGA